MAITALLIKGGILSGLPSLANREPGYVTDQPRLYVGNTGLGNTLLACLNKIDGTTAPTVNEDAGDGYSVGSVWTDTTNDKSYVCCDSTVGAAVWKETTIAAAGTPTAITVANEATDTTCFLSFFTAATGDLGPKTNSALAFNSDTGVLTLTSDPIIPDEAYDATNWNGVLEPPTKNAVRDKIEDILDGVTFTGDISVPDEAYGVGWNASVEVPTKNAIYDKIESLVTGGDVVGPAGATDLAIARFDGTTGKLIQNSSATIDDLGVMGVVVLDAVTNATTTGISLNHNTSGAAAAGFGVQIAFKIDSATVPNRSAGLISAEWVDATDATRKARVHFHAVDTASRECIAIAASGTAAQIGFLGATPSPQLASPDLGTLATTFGFASGTPTFGAANLTGNVALARLSTLSYILLQDQKSSGTAGGTFTSGAWRTRVLNTEVADSNSECSLASNQFTLTAGTYEIHAQAPATYCGAHQLKLYNATDAADILIGPNVATQATLANGDSIAASVFGVFTVAASKALEIQHRCTTTRATDGLGWATSWGTEIYCTVLLRRVG